MITPEIMTLAQRLATSRHRYISDQALSACIRQWSPRLSLEDARRAAIVADRIRRHRQAEEGRPSFHVDLVPLDAPIELIRPIKRQKRKAGGGRSRATRSTATLAAAMKHRGGIHKRELMEPKDRAREETFDKT